jgi:hypothetical protein
MMDRHQLDGRYAQQLQVLDRSGVCDARVRPTDLLRDGRVRLREALDVRFVDDGLVPRVVGFPIAVPVETVIRNYRLRDVRSVVGRVEGEIALGIIERVRERLR